MNFELLGLSGPRRDVCLFPSVSKIPKLSPAQMFPETFPFLKNSLGYFIHLHIHILDLLC